MNLAQYVKSISHAANTILEGMAVTFSHLFREPITVQYPERTERPVSEMLPQRYRGFLEVQMDICTGCKRCERNCPIECIAIDLEKNPESGKKEMARFDIDMGKCMYCGLCVEACKFESTGAIRHTREFEGATTNFGTLTFRFIPTGGWEPLYKAPKDKSEIPVGIYGPGAREARERAMRDNPEDLVERQRMWLEKRKPAPAADAVMSRDEAHVLASEIAAHAPAGKVAAFASLLEMLTPRTDCELCGYPTCRAYAEALAAKVDEDTSKCEPGGDKVDAHLAYALRCWLDGPEAADTAIFGAPPDPAPEPEAAPATAGDDGPPASGADADA